jgi:hypothetical protein
MYRSKSSYGSFFVGSIKFSPWKRIWKRVGLRYAAGFSYGWKLISVARQQQTAWPSEGCLTQLLASCAIKPERKYTTMGVDISAGSYKATNLKESMLVTNL